LSPRPCQSTRQARDPVAGERDAVLDHDRVGEPRPVEVALDSGRDDGFVSLDGDREDLELDVGSEDLALAPVADRVDAAPDAAGVVDDGVFREAGEEPRRIMS